MLPIVKGILKGENKSISKAISIIDNDESDSPIIIREIFKETGRARTVGFTGTGGAGKSTLIGKLASEFQKRGLKVAILAVDPSSPITGGAILGDRVRMLSSIDDQIYMRSLASRGAEGGISRALRNVIRVLDAAGYDIILIESVGAGQSEIEISKVVNITVVLFTPNTGDGVQAIKAGLNEVGDIYIVNKADLEGASVLYRILLDLIADDNEKKVLKCSAKTGRGILQVAEVLHQSLDEQKYTRKERRMIELELLDMVLHIVKEKSTVLLAKNKEYNKYLDKILNKEIDPYTVAMKFGRSLVARGR
ncbi:MAG TPA: methylmalonyl Co-A mutase-associated GTPase MeaB [Nitrososphaeraceae archaeon]|jgi:LAO/AO transport system kinase